ncbi:MAG: hypothetical protein KIS94_02605 [Chitinophagales bacterium]|nr:hypothetical protein [Chitinophagales bacterium]
MKKLVIPFLFSMLLLQTACNKEKRYIYQVQEQELYQSANEKQTLKTTTQFISIAYSDLFGTTITNSELTKFDVALQAFGDKAVLQDMIVKSLLNRSGVQIPSDNAMRADVAAFVEGTYLRIYNRKPNEFEAWKMKDLIEKNADITVKMVYYSLMTSEEYRYY